MDEEKKGGKVVKMPGVRGVPEAPHLSPAFVEKWNELIDKISDAVDEAVEFGMIPHMIVGILACVQADVLESMRYEGEDE